MDKWNVKVVRINFGIGGDIDKQIETKLRPALAGVKGEIHSVIYTNPTDIQKAIIFIIFKGEYEETATNSSVVEKGGVKAEIIKG